MKSRYDVDVFMAELVALVILCAPWVPLELEVLVYTADRPADACFDDSALPATCAGSRQRPSLVSHNGHSNRGAREDEHRHRAGPQSPSSADRERVCHSNENAREHERDRNLTDSAVAGIVQALFVGGCKPGRGEVAVLDPVDDPV